MNTTAVKVGGAWAALEYQHEQQKAVILELCSQLTAVQDSYKQLSLKHAQLQAEHNHQTGEFAQAALQLSKLRQELAEVNVDLDTSGFLGQELKAAKEEEVSHLNQTVHDLEGAAARSEATYQLQIKQLEQQVAELRDIIDSSMHTKRASTLKLETAMNALNLSKGDAKRFIQELQAVKGKVEQLTAERDKALSESVTVRQQRDCHADHAQLLVKENKRLSTQLQTLRLQHSQPGAEQLDAASSSQHSRTDMQSKQNFPAAHHTQSTSADAPITQKNGNKQFDGSDVKNVLHKKQFDGSDVKNVLHKKPFDLSKGSMQQPKKRSQTVLMQAQQIRSEARTLT